jgi:hypothetical protein
MAGRKTATKEGGRYRVLNPRGLPAGAWIIRFKSKAAGVDERWCEGDTLDPPKGMDIKRFLRDGFVEEVT